jgi:DnaJ homolog subfamily C member 1
VKIFFDITLLKYLLKSEILEPEAEQKFRHIVAINDVLKDEVKRARYDQILEHGMPDWRMPIYYFRRVRKLSITELSVAISIIVSIGHYFVLWAQHFEKKLTLEDRMEDIKKKVEKQKQKKRKNAELEEIDASLQKFYDSLPSPTLKDTIPYRFTIWSFRKLINFPFFVKDGLNLFLFPKKEIIETEQTEQNENEYQTSHRNETDRLHLELNPKKIEKSIINAPVINYDMKQTDQKSDNESIKKTAWTDKDKSDLIKAMVKFPAGLTNRWVILSKNLI